MRITFHIGLHKTGFTSTYDMLVQNQHMYRPGFRAFHNLTPEIEPIKSATAAFMLHPTKASEKRVADELTKLVTLAKESGTKHLLISSAGLAGKIPKPWRAGGKYEHLSHLVQVMLNTLSTDSLEIVIVTREERRWIKSLYAHQLRSRGIRYTENGFYKLFEPEFSFDSIVSSVRETGALVHHVRFEEDTKSRLGPGTGVLKSCGFSGLELEEWVPGAKKYGYTTRKPQIYQNTLDIHSAKTGPQANCKSQRQAILRKNILVISVPDVSL